MSQRKRSKRPNFEAYLKGLVAGPGYSGYSGSQTSPGYSEILNTGMRDFRLKTSPDEFRDYPEAPPKSLILSKTDIKKSLEKQANVLWIKTWYAASLGGQKFSIKIPNEEKIATRMVDEISGLYLWTPKYKKILRDEIISQWLVLCNEFNNKIQDAPINFQRTIQLTMKSMCVGLYGSIQITTDSIKMVGLWKECKEELVDLATTYMTRARSTVTLAEATDYIAEKIYDSNPNVSDEYKEIQRLKLMARKLLPKMKIVYDEYIERCDDLGLRFMFGSSSESESESEESESKLELGSESKSEPGSESKSEPIIVPLSRSEAAAAESSSSLALSSRSPSEYSFTNLAFREPDEKVEEKMGEFGREEYVPLGAEDNIKRQQLLAELLTYTIENPRYEKILEEIRVLEQLGGGNPKLRQRRRKSKPQKKKLKQKSRRKSKTKAG